MILKILNEIASIGSTKQKQAILEKNKDNELLKRVYRLTYSRGLQYYIKKWPKPGIATQSFGMLTLTDMLDFIEFTLAPNTYTITATYKQFSVKNKVVIKSTIVTKNVVKKKSKTAYFYAKLLDSNGKILKYKKVKFTFKGKTYTVKTNSKGIASYKLKNTLKVGKYTIYTSYGTLKDKRTITVVK